MSLWIVAALGCGDDLAAMRDSGTFERDAGTSARDSGGPSDTGVIERDAGSAARDSGPATGSAGCGESGRTGAWQQDLGERRGFFVSVPEGYDSSRPHRLYIAVHGTGWSGEMIRPYYDIEEVPGGGDELFIYPDRDPSRSNLETTGEAADEDLAYFDEMMEWVTSRYCIDTSRIFAMGHSGGGNWVTFLSCHRGDVLRAVVPTGTGGAWWYSGLGPGDVSGCRGPVPALVVHGRMDSIIPYDPWGLETLDYFRTLNGCGEGTGAILEGTDCALMAGCTESYDCSHDELTPFNDGHQIPSWHRAGVMSWLRSF
ncbi:MAG: hypothetical protein AAGE52_10595 [Myxococcota bacterium]